MKTIPHQYYIISIITDDHKAPDVNMTSSRLILTHTAWALTLIPDSVINYRSPCVQQFVSVMFTIVTEVWIHPPISYTCYQRWCTLQAVTIHNTPIFNSNLTKYHSSITSISIAQSFWNFAQSMVVPLPCSVQNFKMIGQLRNKLWANELKTTFEFNRSCGGISYIATTPCVIRTLQPSLYSI